MYSCMDSKHPRRPQEAGREFLLVWDEPLIRVMLKLTKNYKNCKSIEYFFFQIHTRYHVVFTFLFEQEYFAIFQLDRGVIWLRQYPQRILMRQAVQSV